MPISSEEDGMSQSKTQFAFFNDKIVPIEEAKISVMTHALNYGTGVFGGLRGYWNADEEQLFIFRPLDHFKRFTQSANLMRINLKYTPADLVTSTPDMNWFFGFQ